MLMEKVFIEEIPAMIWGKESSKVFIAVHGNMSNKADTVIQILAENVIDKGYQVLSFDLPEHGERKEDRKYLCNISNCVSDLIKIINYAKGKYTEINLFACSMGAYFSLIAYKDEIINKCMFLSPVTDMKIIIENMMKCADVSENELKEKKIIKTDFGATLYWDYYCYVRDNPVKKWNSDTCILYASRDNTQSRSMLEEFVKRYDCKLDVLEGGEHFFHTKEQLDYYAKWLENNIK